MPWEAPEMDQPATSAARDGKQNGHNVKLFSASADESVIVAGVLPAEYAGTALTLRLHCGANATTGVARMEASVEAIIPGTTSYNSDSFDTANTASITIASAFRMEVLDITLTNKDGIAATNDFRIKILRDGNGSGGTDSLAAELQLHRVELFEGS